jgi:hypothetical protein
MMEWYFGLDLGNIKTVLTARQAIMNTSRRKRNMSLVPSGAWQMKNDR